MIGHEGTPILSMDFDPCLALSEAGRDVLPDAGLAGCRTGAAIASAIWRSSVTSPACMPPNLARHL